METCHTCKFGFRKDDININCKRFPPTVFGFNLELNGNQTVVEQHQPWMTGEDWCGEYKKSEK